MTIIKHLKFPTLVLLLAGLALITPAQAQNAEGIPTKVKNTKYTPTPAENIDIGLYISVAGGYAKYGDIKNTVSGTTSGKNAAATGTHVFDATSRASIAFGTRIGDSFRSELEITTEEVSGKLTVNMTQPTVRTGSINSTTTLFAVMGNYYYDFMAGSAIRPYVLVGGGFTKVTQDTVSETVSDTGSTFQAGAGASYALTDNVDLFTDYRYRVVLVEDEETTGTLTVKNDSNFNSHAVNFGLRYGF